MSIGPLREAAAPLLLIGTLAAAAVLIGDVWLAAGLAALAGTGSWPAMDLGPELLTTLLAAGPDALLVERADATVFHVVLIGTVGVELAAIVAVAVVVGRLHDTGVPRRSLLRRGDLGDLTGTKALARARTLRPAAVDLDAGGAGLRLLSVDGRPVSMSWEDVALVIMGPRSNKTSAIAVPTVLAAPGLAVATSNKADLWALTTGMRGAAGPVWTFDPQRIAHTPQNWWWNPLRSIADADPAERVEAAARLAGHFVGTIAGERKDPFFHAAAEQILTGCVNQKWPRSSPLIWPHRW